MVVSRRVGIVRLAVVVMAMPPEHQFFQHKKHQNSEQYGRRSPMRIAMFQRVRQYFQERSPKQGTNRIGNQHADAMRSQRNAHQRCSNDAQCAAGQRYGNDPGKSAHGIRFDEKPRIIRRRPQARSA